jgi:hypothetical protein
METLDCRGTGGGEAQADAHWVLAFVDQQYVDHLALCSNGPGLEMEAMKVLKSQSDKLRVGSEHTREQDHAVEQGVRDEAVSIEREGSSVRRTGRQTRAASPHGGPDGLGHAGRGGLTGHATDRRIRLRPRLRAGREWIALRGHWT